ncbi:MAG: hypothetical protein PWR02_870 [Synergistales bacterium]|nr:hypothetical protein [Synergistales bacterium]
MAKLRLLLKRSGKAFTFVELLIAMVILAIVSGAVIMLGYTYFHHFEQANELSMARERGIMVVTYLEKRILNAGLGMPSSETSFKSVFGDLWEADDFKAYTTPVASRDWNGPIYLPEMEKGEMHSSDELVMAYALPSGVYVASQDYVNDDEEGREIELSDPPDGFEEKISKDAPQKTKSWVLFPSVIEYPSSRLPLLIKEFDGSNTITLRAIKGSGKISENDELHLVRFLKAFVKDGTFYAQDMTVIGAQPVVDGILGCKFSYDDRYGVLSVSVLSRGNKKYSHYVAPSSLEGWETIEDSEWRKYYLTVVNKGWRVRNR